MAVQNMLVCNMPLAVCRKAVSDSGMIAAGIDIGGTKIEVQLFGEDWAEIDRQRVPTPQSYPELVEAVVAQIRWAEDRARGNLHIGIGSAGLVNAETGLMHAANLPAMGQPFPKDIADAAGRKITFINDARAFTLSEAVFGAGKGHRAVMSLILGTGVGGGLAINGQIQQALTGTGGEFGHMYAPAHIVAAYGLPIRRCGCGRMGCIETYVSGDGLVHLAEHLTGQSLTAPEIAALRGDDMAQVWAVWCAFIGELVISLTFAVDPDVIVLGGGLSKIDGVADDITTAAKAAQIGDFSVPKIVLAEAGDTSGARGAAFAAWQEGRR